MFHPDSVKENTHVPPIVITGFRKFDKPIDIRQAIGRSGAIELSYKEDVLSFEFAALDFARPEKNQYAYKLEGFDKDWVYCGTRRTATYTNLDGGEYLFRAKGSNNDGVWNEEGASIAVIITPPFWATWLFRTLFVAAIAGSIGGTIRYIGVRKLQRRLRILEQQHALERERLRISGDLHDELASNLSSIAMFSRILQDEMASAKEGAVPKPQLLERITTLAQESVDSIREIIWAIDPKEETLEKLLIRLRDMVAASCRAKGIHCRFDQPKGKQLASTNLPPELRRQLWLLLKEAVNNALKHSRCTELVLSAEYSGGILNVVVRDNGVGFDPAKVVRGKGLGTMRTRSEQIGASLELKSGTGEGTSFLVSLKI
jgi:signal transduction histidine kinase